MDVSIRYPERSDKTSTREKSVLLKSPRILFGIESIFVRLLTRCIAV